MDGLKLWPPVLVGERVVWLGSGSGLPQGGTVRWIGKLPEMGPDWTVGLELDNPLPYGGIDGSWGNRHLFTCEPKHGLLVPITKTIRESDLFSWPFNSLAAGDAHLGYGGGVPPPRASRHPQPPQRQRPARPAAVPDATPPLPPPQQPLPQPPPPPASEDELSPPPQPPARKSVTGRPRPALRSRRRDRPPLLQAAPAAATEPPPPPLRVVEEEDEEEEEEEDEDEDGRGTIRPNPACRAATAGTAAAPTAAARRGGSAEKKRKASTPDLKHRVSELPVPGETASEAAVRLLRDLSHNAAVRSKERKVGKKEDQGEQQDIAIPSCSSALSCTNTGEPVEITPPPRLGSKERRKRNSGTEPVVENAVVPFVAPEWYNEPQDEAADLEGILEEFRLPSPKDRGSSLKSILSGRTFVTCTSGEYSDYNWFDADAYSTSEESLLNFLDCESDEDGGYEPVEIRSRRVSDIYSVVIKRKIETLERRGRTDEDEDTGTMRTPEDNESSLEEDVRAPAAASTNSTPRRSSGFFSFFRWFRKANDDEGEDNEEAAGTGPASPTLPATPSSVRLVRTQSSSCGSIDTLFSTATVNSFSFVTPTAYRPYGSACAPEKWIAPGPETDTYRHRVLQRERLREQDKGLTLRRKYHLFGSDSQLRGASGASPPTSPVFGKNKRQSAPQPQSSPPPRSPGSPTSNNSTLGRKKRRAPPPPVSEPKPYNDYSLPSSWKKDSEEGGVKKTRHRRAASESAKDKKAGAYCHVKGKRKAPPPPSQQSSEGPTGSLDRFRARVASFGNRKKRPAPQPPVAAAAKAPEPVKRNKKDQETQAEGDNGTAASKLSPEERERLIANIAKLKAHALTSGQRHSMCSSPPTERKEFVVCNDSLRLERGVLKPNKDMPKAGSPAQEPSKAAPVSPRPWYKRSLSTASSSKESTGLSLGLKKDIFKSLEKRKDKEKEKEEEWSPEAGIPRVTQLQAVPSDGGSVASSTSTTSSSSRFNIFARLEERGKSNAEKRRSQLSMLANISELDREAAAIVQKEQAREQAIAAAHDAQFYSYPNAPPFAALADPSPESSPERTNENVEVPKRSSAKELISLFNAIGNVTKVTVNSAFFSREGSGFFSREGVEKRLSFSGTDGVKTTTTTTTTMEEKVVFRDTKGFKQQKRSSAVVEANGASGGVEIEEVEDEREDAGAGTPPSSPRSRVLYEEARARRHHSPSPSIPTIAEQSESTTPASTLDPGSKRSSVAEAPTPAVAPVVALTPTTPPPAATPDPLLHAKKVTIWACPRCTLENPRWRLTCDACGRWRPPIPDVKPEEAAAVTATPEPKGPAKSDGASEKKDEIKHEVKQEIKTDVKVELKPELKTEPKAADRPSSSVKQEPKSETKASVNGITGASKEPKGKGEIDWEQELKRYFPKNTGDAKQPKAEPVAAPTAKVPAAAVVQNGVPNSGETKPVEIPKKLAPPSTFIGGRTKQDEAKVKKDVSAATVPAPAAVAGSPPQAADVDEVRKARLAFFSKPSEEDPEPIDQPKEKAKPKANKKEAIYAGLKLPSDENEKRKLKEMLKEMKDSLPRYPKGNESKEVKVNGVVDEHEKVKDLKVNGEIKISETHHQKQPQNQPRQIAELKQQQQQQIVELKQQQLEQQNRGAIKKILTKPQQNGSAKEEEIQAVFITTKTVYEETKIRRGGLSPKAPKVSTSCQTSSVVKKIEVQPQPSAAQRRKDLVLPLSVEELSSTAPSAPVSTTPSAPVSLTPSAPPMSTPSTPSTSSRTFELIRPRDFATIEATKTKGVESATAAHVYANLPPSSPRSRRARQHIRPVGPVDPQPSTSTSAVAMVSDPVPASAPASTASWESGATTSTSPPASSPPPSSPPASSPPAAPEEEEDDEDEDEGEVEGRGGGRRKGSSSCSATSDSSEVERLTAQLTLPKGLADFKADLAAEEAAEAAEGGGGEGGEGGGGGGGRVTTLAVNRLLRRLEGSIASGQHAQAARLARELARLKISCSVTRQRQDPKSPAPGPQPITVDLYVEDKVSHQGPIPLRVSPAATVADLKQRVEKEFEIPLAVQRWILGRRLADDDSRSLQDHGVTADGCPVFLYLVAPDGDQEGEAGTPPPSQSPPQQPQQEPAKADSPKREAEKERPPPPPPQKGGGWYFDNEHDRYSFCEDESEAASEEEEEEDEDPRKNKTIPQKEPPKPSMEIPQNPQQNGRGEEETEEEDEEEEEEEEGEGAAAFAAARRPTLIQPTAIVVHDKPVVIEPPAATTSAAASVPAAMPSLVAPAASATPVTPLAPVNRVTPTPVAQVSSAPVAQRRDVTTASTSLAAPRPKADTVGTMKLGWKCPTCTLMNSPTRPGCAACTTERPLTYVVPVEYRASAHELERIRKEMHSDREMKKVEAQGKEEKKEHYQALVDLDNTDLVPNLEPFDCPVCLVPCAARDGVVVRDCLHTFCKPCLQNTVQFNEEAEVKCPYRDNEYACDSVLQEREIKALVPQHVYEQHLAKSVTQAENKIGNAFHCKTPDCRGWCIFEDNVNEFRCPVCRVINCLTCQAIHEAINCKQYQEQVQQQSETNAEARRTKEMLEEMVVRGEAMACPTCQVVLMKKWGCDWLRCSMCKTEICWVTRGPRWGPGGKGDTTGGCQCGVNGVKCHPRCNYCH